MSRVGAPSFLEISRESWVVLPRPQPAMVGPTAGLNEVALASKAPRCAPSFLFARLRRRCFRPARRGCASRFRLRPALTPISERALAHQEVISLSASHFDLGDPRCRAR
jgi:hypothetical protein